MTDSETLAAMQKQIDQAKVDTAVLKSQLTELDNQMKELIGDQDPEETQRLLLKQIDEDREKRKKDLNELKNAVLWDLE